MKKGDGDNWDIIFHLSDGTSHAVSANTWTKKFVPELLENLKAPFAQYDDPKGNHIKFHDVGWWNMPQFLRDFTYRSYDHNLAMPLSLAEITAIFHFTAEKVTTSRELKRSFAKQTPAPVEASSAEGITLGINRYGATQTPVKFSVPLPR